MSNFGNTNANKSQIFLTNTSVDLWTPTQPNRERENHLSHGFIKHVNHDCGHTWGTKFMTTLKTFMRAHYMFHPQKCSTNLTAVLHFAGSIHESLRNTQPNILGVMSRFQPELIYICVARLSASVTEQLYVKNRTWLILCRPGQIIVHWSCENVRKRYGRNSITRMSLWTSLLPPFKRDQCGIVEVMRLQIA